MFCTAGELFLVVGAVDVDLVLFVKLAHTHMESKPILRNLNQFPEKLVNVGGYCFRIADVLEFQMNRHGHSP